MKNTTFMRAAITVLAVTLPSVVLAHPGHLGHEPTLADGLLHPFTGLDHIVLLAGGGALLAVAQPQLRLTKATILGLFGVLCGGFAAMMGSVSFALLGLIGAFLGFAVAGFRRSDGHARFLLIGTAMAICAQAASHLLAWGDAPPNFEFAVGFGLASVALFALACLLTRTFMTGQQLPGAKAQ